jgi:UDP-glucose 4-epimerase
MKILITGGAGFIGSNLTNFLVHNDHQVVVIDDFSTGKNENLRRVKNKIKIIHSKVEDFNLSSLVDIEGVVHLAAQASVPLSISNFKESSTTNILSSLNIFDYCVNKKLPLVYASSSAVYGEMKVGNDESNIVDLMSPYSIDKYFLDLYSAMLWRLNGLSSIGLRFFNVYGPNQDPSSPYSGVISIFIDKIINQEVVSINGGNQTRDFIYIDDVIQSIYRALRIASKSNVSDYVNVLTGRENSIKKLFDIISNEINMPTTFEIKPLPFGDPLQSNGTSSKMRQFLGLDERSFISLDEGIRRTIKYIKNSNG